MIPRGPKRELVYSKDCSFATEKAIGVLIIIIQAGENTASKIVSESIQNICNPICSSY